MSDLSERTSWYAVIDDIESTLHLHITELVFFTFGDLLVRQVGHECENKSSTKERGEGEASKTEVSDGGEQV